MMIDLCYLMAERVLLAAKQSPNLFQA